MFDGYSYMTQDATSDSGTFVIAEQTHARREKRIVMDRAEIISSPRHQHEEIRREFETHEKKWKADTRFISAPSQRYLHPSYVRIIGLGTPVVPLILKSMEKNPFDWFFALRATTGANPVTSDMAGDVRRMAQAWVEWGKSKGLL